MGNLTETSSRQLSRLICFIVLLAIASCVARAADFDPPSNRWILVPCPSVPGVGQGLFAVTAISVTDAWAVGDAYNQAIGDQQTLIQHWDGTRWQIIPSPSIPNAYNHLTGVSGSSANDVWAAGYTINDSDGSWRTLLLHWNGASWRIARSARLNASFSTFTRVLAFAADDVWLVGYSGTFIIFHTLAEHWDGQSWKVVGTPAPGIYDGLYGIGGSSPTDLWAVGYYKTGNEIYESLTIHWDGSNWSEVESPNTTTYNWFNGITATGSNDVWAVGFEYEDSGTGISHPLTQRWNGSDWSVISNPRLPDGYYTNLADVAWLSSTDVVAVGTKSDERGNFDPLVEQWNGAEWTLATVPEIRGLPTTEVFGIAPDQAGGYWAVGWAQRESPLTFNNYIIHRVP
jgi:hypothetical protein